MSHLSAVEAPRSRLTPAPFACNLIRAGVRAAWIEVSGELDLVTSPQLERALRAAQLHARLVVLDTREVSFIDCSGVHAIVDANAGADWGAPRLILIPGEAVDRLLKLAGMDEQIWTFDLAPGPVPKGLLPEMPAPARSGAAGSVTDEAESLLLRRAIRSETDHPRWARGRYV